MYYTILNTVIDSTQQIDKIEYLVEEIAKNTEPFFRSIGLSHLSLWSFVIAVLSLTVGGLAAFYSWKGYIFQKKSAEHLESLLPGLLSYHEIAGSFIDNMITIEAIYFGKLSYYSLSTKTILSKSKLPTDLIQLEKFAKNQICFDEAFKLKESWQSYNDSLDNLIEISSKNDQRVLPMAMQLIDLTKTEIIRLQKFYKVLYYQKILEKKIATNDNISFYIMNRFCDTVEYIRNLGIKELDTTRTNLNSETKDWYVFSPYFPLSFNFYKYKEDDLNTRVNYVDDDYSSNENLDPLKPLHILELINEGELDYLAESMLLPEDKSLKDMDLNDFKTSYYNYIEPILLGFKRIELSTYLTE